ncbi:MAG: DEAD/DEAH box helicase [Acidobacteriota bacterium]
MKDYAAALLAATGLTGQVVHRHDVPPHPAATVSLPTDLHPSLGAALRTEGIERLFTHQAEAIAHARGGRSVLLATPTASGKSLAYNIPVLDACLRTPEARALYLFPYKALEQDQRAALARLAGHLHGPEPVECAIYDGDTPPEIRRKLRASPPHVLITNPDMVHLGLLPHHGDWHAFLAHLRFVVVDEMHVYRGVFGTHLHHILQRLRRICRYHGSSPVVVASSATVGEPARLGRDLLAAEVEVVHRSGAPRSGRHVVFLDPRMTMSPYTVATRLLVRALQDGRRTIAFTKARRVTELMHSWTAGMAPELRRRIASYRAGYLPEERRAIEARLASGDLLGVISTSALEHGIDIGGLDVCVLVGYPGSIISSWQRIGRVGRSERGSLVLLVGMPDALDQYFLSHPDEFFSRPYERVIVDAANPILVAGHLVCAGAELPLTAADATGYGPDVFGLIPGLVRTGRLVADESGAAWYSLRRAPQRDVHLRSAAGTFEIRDRGRGRRLGTIDAVRARLECHPGAIYLHAGRSYLVRKLDIDRGQVEAEPAPRVTYFTVPLTEKETEILERHEQADHGSFRAGLGRLKVTTHFRGFARRSLATREVVSEHPLDLPPATFETVGLWVELPPSLGPEITRRDGHFMGGIHATEHAAIGLFPLLALCDRFDLGGISYPHHAQIGGPAFFIYDGHAGGIGLARQGYVRIGELLDRTWRFLAACPCEEGCPSCVQSPKCGNGNRPLDKAASLFLLEVLTGRTPVPAAPDTAVPVRTGPKTAMPDPAAPQPAAPDATVAPAPAVGAAAVAPALIMPEPVVPVSGSRGVTAGRSRPESGRQAGSGAGQETRGDLVFDLETLRSADDVGGWSHSADMGLALAVVWDRGRDVWTTYRETDVKDLIIDLLSARRVIGFNVRRFDYTVLSAYAPADFGRIPTLDLLDEIYAVLGFRLSLGHLAETTLGMAKGGDGLASLEWVRTGRWDLVETYCRKDVEITARLFDHGRDHGHLLFRDRAGRTGRVPATWAAQDPAPERC